MNMLEKMAERIVQEGDYQKLINALMKAAKECNKDYEAQIELIRTLEEHKEGNENLAFLSSFS